MTVEDLIKQLIELKDNLGGDTQVLFNDSSGYPYYIEKATIDDYNDIVLEQFMSYWNYRVFEKVLNKYEHDTSYEGLCGEGSFYDFQY